MAQRRLSFWFVPRPVKRRVSGGRVTAKGTRPQNYVADRATHTGFDQAPPSPIWVPILMFSLLGLGMATIIVNYVAVFWETSNVVLLVGLGFILSGIMTATKFR